MRRPQRYGVIAAIFHIVLMTASVISNYGLWGFPERFSLVELQEVLVWPFHWITEPLLATDKMVPIWSLSGRANEAAAWRELVVYNTVGTIFYAFIAAAFGSLRDRCYAKLHGAE